MHLQVWNVQHARWRDNSHGVQLIFDLQKRYIYALRLTKRIVAIGLFLTGYKMIKMKIRVYYIVNY